ncbi:MAG: hypothetical protein WBQ23_03575 [Bacteroidota bacterium]
MKLRLMLLLPLLLLSCSDDPEGQSAARVVYYLNGDAGSSTDFRRYVIDREMDEAVVSEPVVWISEAAANGKVLFETNHGSTVQLFGRCETGQIIPVPLPVSTDPGLEYIYSNRSQSYYPYRNTTALAYEGHHAGFLTWRRPVGSTDSTTWDLQACIFDCGAWSMQEIAISEFLRSYFQSEGSGFRLDVLQPQTLEISNDGSAIVLDLIVAQKEGGNPVVSRRVLLGGTLAGMHVIRAPLLPANEPSALQFDPAAARVYITTADKTIAYDCLGGSQVVSLSGVPPSNSGFEVLSAHSGEVVRYSSAQATIILYRLSDGSQHIVPFDMEKLQISFPEVRWYMMRGEPWCSISPDGEWITFVAGHEKDNGLYLIRRDGTGLRRIATGTFDVRPIVSDVVPY